MLSIIQLYVLAVVDFGCCGYRAAGGRLALLDKRRYFVDAVIRGALLGHIVLAVLLSAVVFSFAIEPDKDGLWREIQCSAQAALRVYVPYATLVLFAMVMRLVPSVDLRSIACTALLGPLLFVRPAVTVIGIVCAALASSRPSILAMALVMMLLMLSFERFVERLYDRQTLAGAASSN